MRELSRIAPSSTIRWANVGKAVVGYRPGKVKVTLEGVCRLRGSTMSGHAMRRGWAARLRKSPHFVIAATLVAVAVPITFASSANATSTFGGFELDGNLNAAAAFDWDSAAVQVPHTQPVQTDLLGTADTSTFTGSKENNPDGWATKSGSPGKDDI